LNLVKETPKQFNKQSNVPNKVKRNTVLKAKSILTSKEIKNLKEVSSVIKHNTDSK